MNEKQELQTEVLKLFKLPAYFDKNGGYFFDQNNQMMGEVRAWGYLKYKSDAEKLQDELGEMIVSAFNEKYTGNISSLTTRIAELEAEATQYEKRNTNLHLKNIKDKTDCAKKLQALEEENNKLREALEEKSDSWGRLHNDLLKLSSYNENLREENKRYKQALKQ